MEVSLCVTHKELNRQTLTLLKLTSKITSLFLLIFTNINMIMKKIHTNINLDEKNTIKTCLGKNQLRTMRKDL